MEGQLGGGQVHTKHRDEGLASWECVTRFNRTATETEKVGRS